MRRGGAAAGVDGGGGHCSRIHPGHRGLDRGEVANRSARRREHEMAVSISAQRCAALDSVEAVMGFPAGVEFLDHDIFRAACWARPLPVSDVAKRGCNRLNRG